MTERSDPSSPSSSPSAPSAGPALGNRLWLGLLVVLLLLAVGLYVWKLVAVDRVESRMAARVDSIEQRAEERLERRTAELLRLSAVPLGFAVREPVLEGNFGLVDRYLSALVQEPGVRQAMVVGPGDSILVATNKNLQGRPVSAAALPERLLPVSETTVRPGPGGSSFAAVPLTGINRQVGALVLEYRPEAGSEVPAPADTSGDAADGGAAPPEPGGTRTEAGGAGGESGSGGESQPDR